MSESRQEDVERFDEVLETVAADFATNPFQYGNEDVVVPELLHCLRRRLDDVSVPVTYRTDYGDEDNWRVRDIDERVSTPGSVCRVRPEVSFVRDGQRWLFDRTVGGSRRTTNPKFDVAVFDDDALVMQSKEEGPGNYFDTATSLSVLCEVKHSKNESSNFYAESKGADDVSALAAYPGEVGNRVFVFFDWWPADGYGRARYDKHEAKLRDNLGALSSPVDTVYIARTGRVERTTYR